MAEEGRITRLQIAKIWASARALGMDSALLHELVPGGSIRGLNRSEASRLIDHLIQLGATRHRPRGVNRGKLAATQDQRNFICFLLGKLGWLNDPDHTRHFLRKYFHFESVEGIPDRRRAGAVIEALKAILRRRTGRQARSKVPCAAAPQGCRDSMPRSNT